jgi:hypothetical protein
MTGQAREADFCMRDSLYQDSPWASAVFAGLCNQGAGQSGAIQDGVRDKKPKMGNALLRVVRNV